MDRPHYIQDDFYLGNGINKVDKMAVYNLADFAISLSPITDEEKKNGFIDESKTHNCISVLTSYMDNYSIYYKDDGEKINNLFKSYKLLINDSIGREYLFRTIHFKFFNQLLLIKGLPVDSINAFCKAHNDLEIIEKMGTTVNKDAALRNYNSNDSKART